MALRPGKADVTEAAPTDSETSRVRSSQAGQSDSASDRQGPLHGKAIVQIFIVCVWLSHRMCNLPVTTVYLGRNSREILV